MIYIFGLGNKGLKYNETRHNVGFDILEMIAAEYQVKLRKSCFHQFKAASINTKAGKVKLIFPLTYMNNSGMIIPSLLKEGDELIVLVDQMDLPVGKIRVKKSDSTAGHNGLKSIKQYYDKPYIRWYIGIDHPKEGNTVVDHVLSTFSDEEKDIIEKAKEKAKATIIEYLNGEELENVKREANGFRA